MYKAITFPEVSILKDDEVVGASAGFVRGSVYVVSSNSRHVGFLEGVIGSGQLTFPNAQAWVMGYGFFEKEAH